MADISSLSQVGPWELTDLLGQNGVVGTYVGAREDGAPKVVVVLDAAQLADPHLSVRVAPRVEALKSLPASRITSVVDFGEADGVVYAAYDKLKGDHLGNRVGEHGLPTPARSLEIMRQTVEALETLHAAGFVHLLITPASIFINEIEQVKLLHGGWGDMVLGVQDGPAHPSLMSNLPFLAPEICAGTEPSVASDVFGIGANLYYLLCGAPVHWADDPAELCRMMASVRVDVSPLAQHAPPSVVSLVQELLELEPDDRPINLEALRERLDMMVGELYQASSERLPPTGAVAPDPPTSPPVTEPPVTELPEGPPESELAFDVSPPQSASAHQDERSSLPPPEKKREGSPPSVAASPPLREGGFVPPSAAPVAAPPPPTAESAPPPTSPDASKPRKKAHKTKIKAQGSSKPIIFGGIAVVLLVALAAVGWALMTLIGAGGGEDTQAVVRATPTPRPTPGPEQERARLEPWVVTVERLALAAEINRTFFTQVGRYPDNDLEPLERGIGGSDLSRDDFTDGWGSQIDFRRQWVFSSGSDAQWNTADDLYVDTNGNALSVVAPRVRLPDDDPMIQRWQAALSAFSETREQGYAPASGDAAGSGDSGAAPEG